MNKRNKNTKADVTEKVKEIKQRQQSWFKQREREKSETRSTDNYGTSSENAPRSTRSPADMSPAKRHPSVGATQVLSEKQYGQGDRKKNGFQNWLQARKTDSNNFTVRNGKGGNTNEVLELTGEDYGDVNEGYEDDASPLSEEMFDSAADRIASRVRKEMLMEERQSGDGGNSSVSMMSSMSINIGGSSGLDSHRCPLCNKVMVAPDHSPTLLIPCGHSYCMKCLNHQSNCPWCKCHIQSMTNNIMLEQIISEYARKNKNTESQARVTPKKPDKDYAAEYQQLGLRCEVLRSESEDIGMKMKDLDWEILQQERQIQGIDRQEDRLHAEIEEIQKKIGQLREHKRDFQDQIEVIQGHKEEEKRRLKVVQATITQLSEDMIKAKTMAQRLNQDINR